MFLKLYFICVLIIISTYSQPKHVIISGLANWLINSQMYLT